MADADYLTPNELFFVRSHAPLPRIDPAKRSHGLGISRVECSVDGCPWRPARLPEPNVAGVWARWGFVRDATPGTHGLRVRATDYNRDNTQPEDPTWNELGHLYGVIVAHPVDVG